MAVGLGDRVDVGRGFLVAVGEGVNVGIAVEEAVIVGRMEVGGIAWVGETDEKAGWHPDNPTPSKQIMVTSVCLSNFPNTSFEKKSN